jgi:hypothetical protein
MAGYTLATLKQAIQDYTDNDETVFVNNLDSFIEAAEERILKEVPLELFRKNAAASLTSGNKYMPKPSDWLFSYALSYTDSNGDKQFLLNKDASFVQEFWPDATDTSAPRYYADYDYQSFILSPTPDAAYNVELQYFYRPPSLTSTSGSTQTWLSENAGQAMLYGSLVEAYTFMKGEPDMIGQYEQSFQRNLARLNLFANAAEGLDFYRRSKD